MIRITGNPDLSIPRNLIEKSAHFFTILEGGDKNETHFVTLKQFFQLFAPFTIDRSRAGNGLDNE